MYHPHTPIQAIGYYVSHFSAITEPEGTTCNQDGDHDHCPFAHADVLQVFKMLFGRSHEKGTARKVPSKSYQTESSRWVNQKAECGPRSPDSNDASMDRPAFSIKSLILKSILAFFDKSSDLYRASPSYARIMAHSTVYS